jgi:hypothetical protein
MSWGIRIFILYMGFVTLILALVFTCLRHKTELEYKDYYVRELNYQSQIDATANADALKIPLQYEIVEHSVRIQFPEEIGKVNGTVNFLRPSDSSKDRKTALDPDENGLQIVDTDLSKGIYKMQISFTGRGKEYYREAVLNFK